MTFMTHGISEKEWNDYLEDELNDQTRDRIEAHLIGCLACWEFHEKMAWTTQSLRAGGREMQALLALQDRQLYDGLRNVFARIQATGPDSSPQQMTVQKRIDELAAVMASMCGSQTAKRALHAAAQVSPARTLEQVNADNWTLFLSSLKSIATVMCGETGAHLVWERGQI
jgi:hypothetical protein